MTIKDKLSEVFIKIDKVKTVLEERIEKSVLLSELNEEKQATYEAFLKHIKKRKIA